MKRIAIIVRERQADGLRMAVGMTVLGDSVDVYIIDTLIKDDQYMDITLEAFQQMGGLIFTAERRNPFEFVTIDEVALRIMEYDVIVPY